MKTTTRTTHAIAPLLAALTLPVLPLLTGCASTPYHKEVRNQANERYDLIQAQMAYDQALQAYATGQFDKAIRLIDGALARFPERPDYLVLKGRIHLETHRLELAMSLFDQAADADPTRADPHYYAGIILQRWSDHPRAAERYRRAFDLEPTNPQYLLASAEALIASQRYDEAHHLIQPRLAQFEHNAALRQLLGQIALLQNRPADAAHLFSQARRINPDDPMLHEELIRAAFAAGDYATCHHELQRYKPIASSRHATTTHQPAASSATSASGGGSGGGWGGRVDLLHLEARCLVMLDRPAEARTLYLTLVELQPTDVTAWVELGHVCVEVGDDRRLALAAARILALDPQRFEGPLLKAILERRQGRTSQAIQSLQHSIQLAPPDACWPHVLLGQILEEQGRADEARQCYVRALGAEPGNRQARERLERLEGTAFAAESGIHQP
ncbi:MAG: tetratricopeptide repeat protein [Phycisphaeraceae bacterium]|nr:MAG: tetratricopeptide repeat protein [Phycisphaeraceae bacterium]